MLAGGFLDTYRRAPITVVAGDGCEVVDENGNRYLDCIGGIAVCALGHAHPAIAAAVAAQARTLVHASNLYHHEPATSLVRELLSRSGMDAVFLCNRDVSPSTRARRPIGSIVRSAQ